jgi:hypothetical protein
MIEVVDDATGDPLTGFAVAIGDATRQEHRARGRLLMATAPVPPDGTLHVSLIDPASAVPSARRFVAAEGDQLEVTLRYRKLPTVRGRVVDADGRPIRDAHAWFGGPEVARGDEPFKPWDRKRMKGASTDSDGRFQVKGDSGEITVWHPDYSPATVPLGEAGTIRLQPRGSIRGVLVDGQGVPRPGERVTLDRDRTVATDRDGMFLFEGVEAGARGLQVEGDRKRWIVVRATPGAEVRPQVGPGIEWVDLELLADGRPASLGEGLGVMLPIGPVGTVHELRGGAPHFRLQGVLPGQYLLLGSAGRFATVRIEGPRAVAEIGSASLVVRAPEGTKIALWPADLAVDDLVVLMARRIQRLRADSERSVAISALPAGEVVVESSDREPIERRRTRLKEGEAGKVDLPGR